MPFVEVRGIRLHYFDVGMDNVKTADPPVLLLHAFPLHAEMWAPQLACLSATRRVIALDLAGFGRSDPPPEPLDASMNRLADDVAELLEGLGVERAVVGGLSMGGYLAFAVVRRHPEVVAGLILADTRASPDNEETFERRTQQQRQVSSEGTRRLIDSLLEPMVGEHTRQHRRALMTRVRDLMSANTPDGFRSALQAMKHRDDSTDHLGRIGVPTLVLVGDQDVLSPPELVRSWQEKIPGSHLVVLPRAGHLSNLEAPAEFNAAVGDFLDQPFSGY